MNDDGYLKRDVQEQYDREAQKLSKLHNTYKKANAEYAKAGKNYMKAKTEFLNTPLGVATQLKSVIEKGSDKVSKLLNDTAKAYKRSVKKLGIGKTWGPKKKGKITVKVSSSLSRHN
jgi:hypothetical protein